MTVLTLEGHQTKQRRKKKKKHPSRCLTEFQEMKTFVCPRCDGEDEFETREKLNQHVRLYHTHPDALPCCYICGKVFAKRKGLEDHGKTTHRECYEVVCALNYCRQVFMLKSEVKHHEPLCRQIYQTNKALQEAEENNEGN